MADIAPFRGVRYAQAKVGGDLSKVMAPPYDVISKDEQDQLYERHPNNVVRLILGKEENKYQSATKLFSEWQENGILQPDTCEAIYVYHQIFSDPVTGKLAPERTGIVCLLKLEEYSSGKVLPHENTLTAAKADRLELLKATNAQFESIYGLFSDPDRSVASFLAEYDDREAIIEEVSGLIGSSHRIEKISDANAINALRELIQDKPIFIADGHHRYETSLNYRREVRQFSDAPDGTLAEDYILITLTAFEDEGLLVLPTHRIVKNVDQNKVDGLLESLGEIATIEQCAASDIEASITRIGAAGRKAIGIVLPNNQSYVATMKPSIDLTTVVKGDAAKVTKQLDVTLLQSLVLDERLGISAEKLASGSSVSYTRSVDDAIQAVQSGQGQAAFILGRPSVQEVRDVSLAGDRMPQKSTFFFPKLLSGLVMRNLLLDNPKNLSDDE